MRNNQEQCHKKQNSKNKLAKIADIEWSHTDPIRTLESIERIDEATLSHEILYTSALVSSTIMPFTVPFQELCCEVGKHCVLDARALYHVAGNKIMDFSMEGIEATFKLSSEGQIYIEKDSLDYYHSLERATKLIKN